MTKISEILGVSSQIYVDDVLEKETAGGDSEQFVAIQILEFVNSMAIVVPEGIDQATAKVLEALDNVIDSAVAGSGVKLPTGLKGYKVEISNSSNQTFKIYPFLGTQFFGKAVNEPINIAPGNTFILKIYTNNIIRY